MKLFEIKNQDENDYMNAEYAQLIKLNEHFLLLIETKINYCFIYSININHQNQVNLSKSFSVNPTLIEK
jgi:hypothetical protein